MKKILLIVASVLFSTGLFAKDEKETLNILLFGHSFGIDCTEHLPKLIDAAGIKTVYLARYFKGNCSMEERYKLFKNDGTAGFTECLPGETEWRERPCSFKQAISERAWDYVIFQNSLENEGKYETAQPYLDEMSSYVRSEQKKLFGREPQICWNLFWPVSYLLENSQDARAEKRLGVYGGKSMMVWDAYVSAAKELSAKTGITCIVPSGTAVMNARESAANEPMAKAFTRDGYHLSYIAGRYLAACCWFEYFIAPKYGISVVGNPLRMEDKYYAVENWNSKVLQECAAAAVRNPFEITKGIGGTDPHRVRIGVISGSDNAKGKAVEINDETLAAWQTEYAQDKPAKWNVISSSKVILEKFVKGCAAGKAAPFVWKGEMEKDGKYYSRTVSYIRQVAPLMAEKTEIKGVNLIDVSKRAVLISFNDSKGVPSAVALWFPKPIPGASELPGIVSMKLPDNLFKSPVAVDLRNGEVWEVLSKTEYGSTILDEVPFYDSPVLIVDRSSIGF